jgi:asparagine synthase (glutamine-hydrolysing)
MHFRTCGLIEAAYPYYDRRLVEFMLAIPAEQKLLPGMNRVLQRRATSCILPREVALRDTKAGALEVICRALRREWPKISSLLTTDARVFQRKYVKLPALITRLESAREGKGTDIFSLIRIISLEAWLRSVEDRQGLSSPEIPQERRLANDIRSSYSR